MLNLLLFQRKRVLHGIGLALGLQHPHGGLPLGLFHLLHLGGIGVGFGDFDLLLVNLGLNAHAVVLLFFQQQRFQALGILLRKFDITQHHFLHHDAVGAQPFANHFGGALTHFFALGGKNFAHRIARHQFAPGRGNHGRHDFFFQRMRQIGFDVVKALGIDLVTHGDGEAQRESFFRLHAQRFAFRAALGQRIFTDSGGEQLVAGVEQFDPLDQRHDEVHSGIQRSGECAFGLAHAHAGHSAGDDHDACRNQQRSPGQHHERSRGAPADCGRNAEWYCGRACLGIRMQASALPGNQQISVVGKNSGGHHKHRDSRAH